MERLTFGYGVGHRHVDAPETRRPGQPPPEDQVRAMVLDPLPGESSDWAYFGLLAFTAVLFFRPQDQLPFLERLHLAEISALVGLSAMVMKRLVRRLPVVTFTPELAGLVAFGLVLVGTTPFSFWPGGSVEVITGMYLKVLLIVVLLMNSLNTPLRLQRFTWLIVLASSYLSIRAVLDYLRGVNLVEGGRVAGAVKGIFGNPNDLALNMVAFLPFAALFALLAARPANGARRAVRHAAGSQPPEEGPARGAARRREGGQRPPAALQRAVGGAAVLLMLLAIVFTQSRSGFLGLAAMGVVFLYYGRRLKPGLAAAAIVLLIAMLPLLPSSFWARMSSITDPSEDKTGSRAARTTVMKEAAQVFADHPLTGIGAGQFKNYNPPGRQERWREAHDVWLQVASETGIFGLLAFLYLVIAAFRAAFWSKGRLAEYARSLAPRSGRGRRRMAGEPASAPPPTPSESIDLGILRLHATALLPSLVGWFVCAIFASVAYNWTFYYLLGLSIVTRDLTREAIAARLPEPQPARRELIRRAALAG